MVHALPNEVTFNFYCCTSVELSIVVGKPTKQKHINKMSESWISLSLRRFATLLGCANRCAVSRRLHDKTISNSLVETTLEPTGIPTLTRCLVAQQTQKEEKQNECF